MTSENPGDKERWRRGREGNQGQAKARKDGVGVEIEGGYRGDAWSTRIIYFTTVLAR